MDRVILFEDTGYRNLLPLVYWRTIGELRCGYQTLIQRARSAAGIEPTDLWVREELKQVTADRFSLPVNRPVVAAPSQDLLFLNARYLPPATGLSPKPGSAGFIREQLAFLRIPSNRATHMSASNMLRQDATDTLAKGLDITTAEGHIIDYPWDLVAHNERLLVEERPNKHELRGTVENGAHLIRSERVTTGKGSRIMPGAVLDASEGPIVIEEQVTVSPLAIVQGPCFIGRNCFVHPGASIRHFCSIGPLCKLGGEIEATIFQGFSNKQHDGFLGHAWIGQWVNLGADTVNSDLKNTYGSVRVPINGAEIDSGRTFVGAFLADHAKTGIGQTFSTGSVVGFAASVATSAFPPKFIPSFSWMTDNGIEEYKLERCLAVAQKVMARREVTMTGAERTLFRSLPALCRSIEHNSTAR